MPLTSPPALCFALYKFRGGFGSPAVPPAEMSPGPLLKSYPPQLAVMRRGPESIHLQKAREEPPVLLLLPSLQKCVWENSHLQLFGQGL